MSKETEMILEAIKNLQSEVTSIKVTLENVTNRIIKRIAEGHLDLSRKLNEAVKADHEKELLLVRVNLLEDEVRQLKEKLNTIA
ncbi:hypothetical protein [Emergencia sp.]|uniref:hypothetical protein n=1 Tax=Emergencia sp. TaxID=1926557 RepID=UPI003AF08D6F